MTKIIDYTINESDLINMDEKSLADIFMYADRDRKELEIAEKIYWWCIKEINRRLDAGEISMYSN